MGEKKKGFFFHIDWPHEIHVIFLSLKDGAFMTQKKPKKQNKQTNKLKKKWSRRSGIVL